VDIFAVRGQKQFWTKSGKALSGALQRPELFSFNVHFDEVRRRDILFVYESIESHGLDLKIALRRYVSIGAGDPSCEAGRTATI
jgi:hypothetical protein